MKEQKYLDSKAQEFFLNANGIVNNGAKGNPINELEVITSKAFIKSCCKKLRHRNTRNSSYGLKHSAEKWGRKINEILDRKIFSDYVSNGAFIKGAIELQFTIFRIEKSYNCNFNMSLKK